MASVSCNVCVIHLQYIKTWGANDLSVYIYYMGLSTGAELHGLSVVHMHQDRNFFFEQLGQKMMLCTRLEQELCTMDQNFSLKVIPTSTHEPHLRY